MTEHPSGAAAPEYGALPELTRGLRALGSARRAAGTMQSVFFRPLLDARRAAEQARTAEARLRAFDAAALRAGLDRSLARIVAEWPDARDAARRAIRAQLDERVRNYHAALDDLSRCAATALAAPEDDRARAWREWTAQLQRVFVGADRSWLAIEGVVASLRDSRRR